MTKHLDPKFVKIVALMNSTTHEGEKQAARDRAEAVAKSCGMTFDEAMKASAQPATEATVNIFKGFDDWCEEREPGYKAKKAAERSKKAAERRERVKTLLARYGSREAILAPCQKEKLLHEALKPWIKYQKPPHQRWTHSVDGSGTTYLGDVSERVHTAIANAYPLPVTFSEAKAEYDYWRVREIEMEDILDDEYGDLRLDRPALFRMEMVRCLAEHQIPVTTLADLHSRFAMYREGECHDEDIEAALFRDLETIVRSGAEVANLSKAIAGSVTRHHPSIVRDGQIADMLQANPAHTDRHIARVCHCSPTTVGKIRKQLGLAQAVRSVQRGGQMFEMKVPS